MWSVEEDGREGGWRVERAKGGKVVGGSFVLSSRFSHFVSFRIGLTRSYTSCFAACADIHTTRLSS